MWQEIPQATAVTVEPGGVLEERPFRPVYRSPGSFTLRRIAGGSATLHRVERVDGLAKRRVRRARRGTSRATRAHRRRTPGTSPPRPRRPRPRPPGAASSSDRHASAVTHGMSTAHTSTGPSARSSACTIPVSGCRGSAGSSQRSTPAIAGTPCRACTRSRRCRTPRPAPSDVDREWTAVQLEHRLRHAAHALSRAAGQDRAVHGSRLSGSRRVTRAERARAAGARPADPVPR